jgi:hypothetical protein
MFKSSSSICKIFAAFKQVEPSGLYYPLGTVPKAYNIFRAYEEMEGRTNKNKALK